MRPSAVRRFAWKSFTPASGRADRIDLSEVERIRFHIRQNVRTSEPAWTCAVQIFFEGGGQALASPSMGAGDWHLIDLPLDNVAWQIEQREQTFGVATKIRFYPYRHLDQPGEFIQIDGLEFVPRIGKAKTLPYVYRVKPDENTDPGQTWLTDGELDVKRRATFAAYGADPVIEFHLGRVQTLTRVTLKAAEHVASADIAVSEDRDQWTTVAVIHNETNEQTLTSSCLRVGQYVRLKLKRPQVDVALRLGEVVLERRATTAADRQISDRPYFDGPELSDDYVTLAGQRLSVQVHRTTGIIGGIGNAVMRGFDRYVFENREQRIDSDEYRDVGRVIEHDGQSLTIEADNSDIPGLKVRKIYRIARNDRESWLEKRTQFTYTGERNDLFVTLLSQVVLTQDYRRGGYYEAVQDRNDRIAADDVHFERVIPPNKSIMLIHPATGKTVTQYRYRVDDRFVLPYYSQVSIEPYNNTSYTPNGWRIGHCTMKLAPRASVSVQVHTALLDDGRFGWERHFVSMPDYRELMSTINRPAWIADIKAIFSETYRASLWDQAVRTNRRVAKVIDDGIIVHPGYAHVDGAWGDLPVSGDVNDLFGGITPSDKLAEIFTTLRRVPRTKHGIYMWLQSVNRESGVYRDHPDWFITNNKRGELQVVFPALKPNFGRILSVPDHRRFLEEQIVALHRRYPQDVWYVDGGCGAVNTIDWATLRTSQDYDGLDTMLAIRRRLKQINPDLILFYNEADDRVADVGYAEIGRHFGRDWREAAASMWSTKVRQYFDPLRRMSPLYLTTTNANEYLRLCTGLGLPPSGSLSFRSKELLQYAPYCAAAYETRHVQFSPTGFKPNWREDAGVDLEIYALRHGPALVLSAVSHAKTAAKHRLSAQIPGDVARPGDEVYVVHHVLKHLAEFDASISDPSAKSVYRETGWHVGSVTEWRAIEHATVDQQGWIEFQVELPTERLNVITVVKSPVFVFSRDGMRANFLLPPIDSDKSAEHLVLRGDPSRGRAVSILGHRGVILGEADDTPPVSIWRDGTLVYAGSPTTPPAAAHNGEYVVKVDGRVKERINFIGRQVVDQLEPYFPPVEPILKIEPVDHSTVTSTGIAGANGGRASVDVDRLLIRAQMPNETHAYYNYANAGIELRDIHKARIHVDHNMFPVRGLYPRRHILYEKHADAFIGFMVDYGSEKGYAKRIALSVGPMNLKRKTTRPDWGRAKPPDHYLRLPETINTGKTIDGVLDFTRWAPADWDGRLWISVVMDNTLRSRWMSLQLTELNPADGPVVAVTDLSQSMAAMKDRQVHAVRFAEAPTIDGKLDEWGAAKATSGFYVVGEYGKAASQFTEVRAGYDDQFIYLAFTCWEKQKKGFVTTGEAAGKPWFDDSVEFSLTPPAWGDRFIHAIANAAGMMYKETYIASTEKHEQSLMLITVKTERTADRFTVEAAVPIAADGVPAPGAGQRWKAQFMRTRVMPDSAREYATWTVSDGYHDFAHFGTVVFDGN